MATITPTTKVVKKYTREITWVGDTADTFVPWTIRGVVPITMEIQVNGGALTVNGSLNGTDDHALKDNGGTDISLADGELSEIIDRVSTITPVPVGTGVTVTLIISY